MNFSIVFLVVLTVAGAQACSDVCSDLFAPTCGQLLPSAPGLTVYREFSNSCWLKQANCRAGNGPKYLVRGTKGCAAQGLVNKCEVGCLANWVPVCASRQVDGSTVERTFSNECSVELESCKDSQNPWKVVRPVEC